MLTKGGFTRDEWKNLLCLFDIIDFSLFCYIHFLSNRKQSTMSKRAQESKTGEEPAVAKPRPMSLVPRNLLCAKQTSSRDSGASCGQGVKSWIRILFQEALGDLRETGARTQQSILKSGKKMKIRFEAQKKPARSIENQHTRTRLDDHSLQVSGIVFIEEVFKPLGQKLNRSENDKMLHLKTYVLLWGLFMSTTMKASVHLGPNYNENLVENRNTNFEELKTFFDITQRLILEHEFEILNVSTIECTFSPCTRSSLVYDQAIKWAKAKVCVYSDSVSCWGRCVSIQKQMKNGQINFGTSNKPTLTELLESMENRLSSSGLFSQDSARRKSL